MQNETQISQKLFEFISGLTLSSKPEFAYIVDLDDSKFRNRSASSKIELPQILPRQATTAAAASASAAAGKMILQRKVGPNPHQAASSPHANRSGSPVPTARNISRQPPVRLKLPQDQLVTLENNEIQSLSSLLQRIQQICRTTSSQTNLVHFSGQRMKPLRQDSKELVTLPRLLPHSANYLFKFSERLSFDDTIQILKSQSSICSQEVALSFLRNIFLYKSLPLVFISRLLIIVFSPPELVNR